jgi:hypothetical protein
MVCSGTALPLLVVFKELNTTLLALSFIHWLLFKSKIFLNLEESLVHFIQQNKHPPFLPEDEERSILGIVVISQGFRFLGPEKRRRIECKTETEIIQYNQQRYSEKNRP